MIINLKGNFENKTVGSVNIKIKNIKNIIYDYVSYLLYMYCTCGTINYFDIVMATIALIWETWVFPKCTNKIMFCH